MSHPTTGLATCLRPIRGIALAAALHAGMVTAPKDLAAQDALTTDTRTPLAFEGLTIIDVTDGDLLPEQTIVIEGNRIQAAGPSRDVKVPKDARVVDARGKYVIPGLWDMHTHTEQVGASVKTQVASYKKAYPQYIASGVTGVREMAQRFDHGADSFRVWQKEVMNGARIGPRAVGPSADLTHKLKLSTSEDAVRIIDSLKAAGDAFVKYHDTNGGNREIFFTLVREAKKVGLPIVGHIPRSVTAVEALDSGMWSIEHVNEHHECSYVLIDSLEAETMCGPTAQAYVRNGTWLTPTLAIFYYYSSSEEDVQNTQAFVRLMQRLGVRRFLAGTDCEPIFLKNLGVDKVCHRGFALLQEVIALNESGLSRLAALQAATISPAQFFQATDSLGTVTKGKLADLVILDDNPLTNIRNILKIRGVVANGRYFDRATLDTIDPRGAQMAKLYADGQPDLSEEPPYIEEPWESETTPKSK